jgi:hypothetical protein
MVTAGAHTGICNNYGFIALIPLLGQSSAYIANGNSKGLFCDAYSIESSDLKPVDVCLEVS